MANQDRPKLTRRQIDNERSRLASQLPQVMNRLVAAANGEVEMTPSQVAAAKAVVAKLMPDISPQDWEQATQEPKTQAEVDKQLADAMSDPATLDRLVASHRSACQSCKDMLTERLDRPTLAAVGQ